MSVSRAYGQRFDYVYSLHVFQKLRALDLNLVEFEQVLGDGEVIAELVEGEGLTRELILLVDWVRPLHLVIAVDSGRREERLVTVYEPRPNEWDSAFKRRRNG